MKRLCAAALLCSGCIHALPEPQVSPIPPPVERPAQAELFAVPAAAPRPTLEPIGMRSGHRLSAFSLPSLGDNAQAGREITGTYFESLAPGRKRFVLVLPIWGSSTYPPDKIARTLLASPGGAGTNLLVLRGKGSLFTWRAMAVAPTPAAYEAALALSAEHLRTAVRDVRQLLDWAESRPEVDPRRLGIVGFSIGAVVAGVALEVEPRLAAGVLVMGGGELYRALPYCDGTAGRTTRQAGLRFGWSEAELESYLEERLAGIDPVSQASRIDPSRVLLFEAARDNCFPALGREAFWQAAHRPRRVLLSGRHKTSFLAMTFLNHSWAARKMAEFLLQRLG